MNCINGNKDRINLSDFLEHQLRKINVVQNGEAVVEERDLCESWDSEDDDDVVCLFQTRPQSILQVKREHEPEIKVIRPELPILHRKAELIEALKQNQILIVVGETGSGKSTQLPQLLKEIGVADRGRIGCTQLRRPAAKKMAERVAFELNCKLGEEVGYSIRFDDRTGPNTIIQFMTTGVLLNEAAFDRTLCTYSAIILDEAHERNIDTDILLGLLRWAALEVRKDLKVIISSATLDETKFCHYFNAPVFHVRGRMFPVAEIYCPLLGEEDYISKAAYQIRRVNEIEDDGDILVFMTGQKDITQLCEDLQSYESVSMIPYYSKLSMEMQNKVFEPAEKGKRKVIVATNIAETALTLNNIRYVIDSGFVKQNRYDHRHRMEILKSIRISKAQATQRAGRAGRVAPGKCYRLYSEYDFWMFVSVPEPEIARSSLTRAVLLLKNMRFDDLSVFHFIDEPPTWILRKAEEELTLLGAIKTNNGEITNIGKKMASFPVEPCLAKMLVVSKEFNCSEEILTIVALLSVQVIFMKPGRSERGEAADAHATFTSNEGDLFSLLNVYSEWLANNKDPRWCKEKFIHSRFMKEAHQLRLQLRGIMTSQNISVRSAGNAKDPILKSICSALILNAAALTVGGAYVTRDKDKVFIHPSSALHRRNTSSPSWVVYHKIIYTNRSWLTGVTPVKREWIDNFTPAFCPPITSEFDESVTTGHDNMRPLQRKRKLNTNES